MSINLNEMPKLGFGLMRLPETDGKIDIDSLEAISFDPYTHGYYKVGGRVGEAFKDGLKLK